MKLLFHICCANCALSPIEMLFKKSQFEITLFWYNPNIQPKEEYNKRFFYAKELSKIYNLPLLSEKYEVKKWFKLTTGLENEPEGGKRCEICFEMRLFKTVKIAKKYNFEFFSTSLSVSPFKNTELINKIGENLAQKHHLEYFPINIDKKIASKIELELSKKFNFYRQKYCGCLYSKV
jgi:ribonuclease HII